jgi:hypothetical protein
VRYWLLGPVKLHTMCARLAGDDPFPLIATHPTKMHHANGSATLTVAEAPVATQVQNIPDNVQVGQPTLVVVCILDASGNLVPDYPGTNQLTSFDIGTTLGGVALPT